jgi:hypothetical protein
VSGTGTFNNNVGVSGALGVTGATTLYDTLTVIGTGTFSTVSALSYNSTSDYRAKNTVEDIDLTEFNVDNLRPVTFNYNINNKKSIGLIAHEVAEDFPFLVHGDKDGDETQRVNYIDLIGVLIKEIQTLKERVTQLENRKN